MQILAGIRQFLLGVKEFLAQNIRMFLWLSIALVCIVFLGTEMTFVYLLTIGAWLVDVTIKDFRIDDNPTMYADLSFVCFISYLSQIVAILGIEGVTRDTFASLSLITFILFLFWLQNIMVCTKPIQSRVDQTTSALCTALSVILLLAGAEIIALLGGS